jgi:hypothetical protein
MDTPGRAGTAGGLDRRDNHGRQPTTEPNVGRTAHS